ncbi:tryptophan--tRNA ligase [candidate division WWE3 bacterium RBG_19FT_COMBO_53_11]|uniref:Tryptophan--tRNA ligase n=1 Tax=candidate division WWE3 bacterium RBG_19FT_COMBO_53_11 TaxID=1802613 RepID=A0A1F4UHZ4_UNCKA|nr:MAG: tryptophan--tRNA ligase [candidate division WWE3 bacterium RBG_16_52_45]OGC44581.1 MAG: tryptophan--tRNA ligase [candidate division WWE3 bacterium RBG_19FT_COMBO_53_11]
MEKKRILTGDRPTGPLHLGHYVGTLKARLELQEQGNEVFILVADYHTLTRGISAEKTKEIKINTRELLLDYLAVGLDPKKITIYRQSDVPAVAELALLFGMLVTVPRLSRVPTLKEVMRDEKIENPSFGLLGYPVLQSADIALVKGELVPVGKDQSSHLEVAREIIHRFNSEFGEVFPEPEALIKGDVLPGTDGKAKMSKSLGNAIMLSDDEKTVKEKVMGMYTDPTRVHSTDPGHVEGNPVFAYLDAFGQDQTKVSEFKDRYQKGTVGDVELKEYLASVLNEFLAPIRTRRQEFSKAADLDKILEEGKNKVLPIAAETLKQARRAIGIE